MSSANNKPDPDEELRQAKLAAQSAGFRAASNPYRSEQAVLNNGQTTSTTPPSAKMDPDEELRQAKLAAQSAGGFKAASNPHRAISQEQREAALPSRSTAQNAPAASPKMDPDAELRQAKMAAQSDGFRAAANPYRSEQRIHEQQQREMDPPLGRTNTASSAGSSRSSQPQRRTNVMQETEGESQPNHASVLGTPDTLGTALSSSRPGAAVSVSRPGPATVTSYNNAYDDRAMRKILQDRASGGGQTMPGAAVVVPGAVAVGGRTSSDMDGSDDNAYDDPALRKAIQDHANAQERRSNVILEEQYGGDDDEYDQVAPLPELGRATTGGSVSSQRRSNIVEHNLQHSGMSHQHRQPDPPLGRTNTGDSDASGNSQRRSNIHQVEMQQQQRRHVSMTPGSDRNPVADQRRTASMFGGTDSGRPGATRVGATSAAGPGASTVMEGGMYDDPAMRKIIQDRAAEMEGPSTNSTTKPAPSVLPGAVAMRGLDQNDFNAYDDPALRKIIQERSREGGDAAVRLTAPGSTGNTATVDAPTNAGGSMSMNDIAYNTGMDNSTSNFSHASEGGRKGPVNKSANSAAHGQGPATVEPLDLKITGSSHHAPKENKHGSDKSLPKVSSTHTPGCGGGGSQSSFAYVHESTGPVPPTVSARALIVDNDNINMDNHHNDHHHHSFNDIYERPQAAQNHQFHNSSPASYLMDASFQSETQRSALAAVDETKPIVAVDAATMSPLEVETIRREAEYLEASQRSAAEERAKKSIRMRWIGVGVCVAMLLIIAVIVAFVVGINMGQNEAVPQPQAQPTNDIPTDLPPLADIFPTYINSRIPESMQDPATAENPFVAKAYAWLVQDPNLPTYQEYQKLQRWVLAVFFYATNGEAWNANFASKEQWLKYDTDECDWFSTTWDDSSCDSKDQFIHLNVVPKGSDKLVGSIPTEIALLTGLQDLEVPGQSLHGPLPSEVGLLMQMTSIKLQGNQFSSSLPLEWMDLVNLRDFNLEKNKLTGILPSEIGILSKLQGRFDLSENSFAGTLPTELGHLNKVASIDLGKNKFAGTIPTQFGLMTGLNEILLQGNSLSGKIPTQLGKLSVLSSLALQGNYGIVQSVPTEICQNTEVGQPGVQTAWCGDLGNFCCF